MSTMWAATIAVLIACLVSAQAVSKCELLREEYIRFPSPPGLMYIPQCTADGSFQEVQCWTLVGYCWCVDELGEEVPNTKKLGSLQRADCSKYRMKLNSRRQFN